MKAYFLCLSQNTLKISINQSSLGCLVSGFH